MPVSVPAFLKTLTWPAWVRILFAGISLWFFGNIHEYTIDGKNNLIRQDKFGYYIYLPAAFIYHDFQYHFLDTFPEEIPPEDHWAYRAPNGALVSKMTMGVALMNTPFFLLAHAQTHLTGTYPAHGLSLYYRFWGSLGALLYAFLALWLLERLLKKWFRNGVVALTLAGICLGTNYFYYAAAEGMMSHGYSFLLITAGMLLTVRLYEKEDWQTFIGLGLVLGLITLIRPTNVLFCLVPALYGITSREEAAGRLKWAARHWPRIALTAGLMLLVCFPQLLIWKYQTGSWLFYSYGREGFSFDNPQIINGLFSYRKGWLVYSPLMLFACLGLAGIYRYCRVWLLPVCITFPIALYVILSWWCWWYGGSFGLRAFVDFYPMLAFGLASCIAWLLAGKWPAKVLLIILFVICLPLNGVQLFQYRRMYIHWDSMTREVYWDVFGRLEISHDEMVYINRNLKTPDYNPH